MRSEGYGTWSVHVCVSAIRVTIRTTNELTYSVVDEGQKSDFLFVAELEWKSQYADEQWLTLVPGTADESYQKLLREKQQLHCCFEDCPMMQLAIACLKVRNKPNDLLAHIICMPKYYCAEGLKFSAFSLGHKMDAFLSI